MSPLGLAPPYDAIGPAVQAVSAHIHCAVLCYLVEELRVEITKCRTDLSMTLGFLETSYASISDISYK